MHTPAAAEIVPCDLEAALPDSPLARLAERPDGVHACLVRWTGDRVPRGVVLPGGLVVGSTQNGMVKDLSGHLIGWYERLVDDGREQEMLVVLPGPAPARGALAPR